MKISVIELNRMIIDDFKSFEYSIKYNCNAFKVKSVIDTFKTNYNKMLIDMNESSIINEQVCLFMLDRVNNLSNEILKGYKRFRPDEKYIFG